MRDPSRYTEKQQHQVTQLVEQLQRRGIDEDEAERRAVTTVSDVAGGQQGGAVSGRGKKLNKAPEKFGGRVVPPISRDRDGGKPGREPRASPTKMTAADTRAARRRRIASGKSESPDEQANAQRARKIICRELVRMAAQGYERVRVRSHRHDSHVQFQGKKGLRWETIPRAEYQEQEADGIIQELETVRAERHRLLSWRTRTKTNEKTFEVGLPSNVLAQPKSQTISFFEQQLFQPSPTPRSGHRGSIE